MNKEEQLQNEISKLRQEIERLKSENEGLSHGIQKKRAEIAGEMTDLGIFEEEIRRVGMANGFDKEEIKVSSYFSLRGHKLERDGVCRCSFCSIILTEGEKIEMNNKIYCEKCYRKEEHDLQKDEFKVLVCAYSGFTSTSNFWEGMGCTVTIQSITGIPKVEAKKKVEKLLGAGYLFLHGILFKRLRVSSKGEEALAAYDQIYRDPDFKAVKDRLFCVGA